MKEKKSLAGDYLLVEQSLNSQMVQFMAGLASVPELLNKKYDQAIIIGMGGSRLPADILLNLFIDKFKTPIMVISDYSLPDQLLNSRTSVIALSYSGQTEEVLTAVDQANRAGAAIYTISSGGQLAKTPNAVNIVFSTSDNSSGQPRYGTGSMVGALLGLLITINIIDVTFKEIKDSLILISHGLPALKKQIQALAKQCQNKIPILIAAEHLTGIVNLWQNQIQETAKNLAWQAIVPDLNHHLLEGLLWPKNNRQNLHFIILQSQLYNQRNQKRIKITEEVIKKQNLICSIIKVNGASKLAQVLSLLMVGGQLALKLAEANKVNPLTVPWVDYFKQHLK
jgi:glucose/mannose-6-phosphate isomerase